MTPDTALKILLRLIGGVELLAIPFIVFPIPWMAAIHEQVLRLGSLPREPIVEYLTRSLSALYAAHGAMIFRLSFDIVRFRPLIRFLGYLHLVFGTTIFFTDLFAGLPLMWMLGEGPGIAVGGLLIVALTREKKS